MLFTELSAADGRRWVAAGLRRGAAFNPDAPREVVSLAALAGSSDAVLMLEYDLQREFDESWSALQEELPEDESFFVVLTPRRKAPQFDPHYGAATTSFLCSGAVWSDYLALQIDCQPETICFALLRAIADGAIDVDRLFVRQLPQIGHASRRFAEQPKALLIPHRGKSEHLRSALSRVCRTEGNQLSVAVGLDVDDASCYQDLITAYPQVKFFQSTPAPVGPYVIRQDLAEKCAEPWLCLQDSDDLSCYDRFTQLANAAATSGCEIIGSHELCLDEIQAKVYPVRYTIDSTAALSQLPCHALLHGTLMARRDAFFRCGGLSTHLNIANDTQFLLRAFFHAKIGNVDEFLYIRRRHATSLTNAPETAHDNPLRRALDAEWKADFAAVKNGEKKLADSSLRTIHRTAPYRMERLYPRSTSHRSDHSS